MYLRKIWLAYLNAAGCRVTLAANGREGVQKFLTASYDAVIMDMQMPVLDGWSATQEIRVWERENNRKAIPIVALTASAMKEDQERCREAGCTLFLAKPVLKHELLKAMASLIGVASNEPLPTAPDTSMAGLLPMFFDETRAALSDMQQALASKDWAQISAKGHQLTGSGSTFGYPIITNFGREVEAAASKRDEPRTRELIDAIANLLSTLHPK